MIYTYLAIAAYVLTGLGVGMFVANDVYKDNVAGSRKDLMKGVGGWGFWTGLLWPFVAIFCLVGGAGVALSWMLPAKRAHEKQQAEIKRVGAQTAELKRLAREMKQAGENDLADTLSAAARDLEART